MKNTNDTVRESAAVCIQLMREVFESNCSDLQMSMVGVRFGSSAKCTRDTSPHQFIPAEAGGRNLVQKSQSASRNGVFARQQVRETQRDNGALPVLNDDLHRSNSNLFRNDMAVRFNFLKIRGQGENESMNKRNPADRMKLPKIRKKKSGLRSNSSKNTFSSEHSIGINSRILPVISNELKNKDFIESPNLKADECNRIPTCGDICRFAGMEDQESNLKRRQLIILPKLGQNSELTSSGSMIDRDRCKDGNGPVRCLKRDSKKGKRSSHKYM